MSEYTGFDDKDGNKIFVGSTVKFYRDKLKYEITKESFGFMAKQKNGMFYKIHEYLKLEKIPTWKHKKYINGLKGEYASQWNYFNDICKVI